MATITLGNCPCITEEPHKKFYADGRALHQHGFFTVDDGKALLRNLIGLGAVPESERERLNSELDASGLPSDPQATREKLVTLAIKNGSFLTEEKREEDLQTNVKRGVITEDMIPEVRKRIKGLSNEERIADGVQFFAQFDLDSPEAEAEVRKMVVPEIFEEVLNRAREAQNFPADIFGAILAGRL